MYMINIIFSLFILALTCLGSQTVLAGTVYQWTDEVGNVHFSDEPPADSITVETREFNININEDDSNNIDFDKYSIINQVEQMAQWRRELSEERLAKRKLDLEEKRLAQELELSRQNELITAERSYLPRSYYYIPNRSYNHRRHGVNVLPRQGHQHHRSANVISHKPRTTNHCC